MDMRPLPATPRCPMARMSVHGEAIRRGFEGPADCMILGAAMRRPKPLGNQAFPPPAWTEALVGRASPSNRASDRVQIEILCD